ncbi:hypothetical protein PMAYCL1PPCAC_26930, partial [Pristionchus mayeri]
NYGIFQPLASQMGNPMQCSEGAQLEVYLYNMWMELPTRQHRLFCNEQIDNLILNVFDPMLEKDTTRSAVPQLLRCKKRRGDSATTVSNT